MFKYIRSTASGDIYICPCCNAETIYSNYCDTCGVDDNYLTIDFEETEMEIDE